MSANRKFVHVGYRIPSELKVELDLEAKRRATNVNSLVGQVLAKHASYDMLAEYVEAVPLSKPLFTRMLDNVEAEDLGAMGEELGPNVMKSAFTFLNLEFNLDGLIENYFRPMSMHSRWYRFNVVGSGPNRKLLFEHGYGPKWSAFLKPYLAGIFRSATGIEPRVTADGRLVTVFV
jgi:hypothetical protein